MNLFSLPSRLFDLSAAAEDDRALAESLTQLTAATPHWSVVGATQARESRALGRGLFPAPVKSPRAEWRTIAGPGGPRRLRVIPPAQVSRGIYLHIHGGGWVLGAADQQDLMLESLADATQLTCVSVEYRLAPEHPYPAGIEDCVAAASHVAARPLAYSMGGDLAIGGESAGAHLAVSTLLRLRDRDGKQPFRAANLVSGFFDLSLTPSARAFGEDRPILRTSDCAAFVQAFLSAGEDRSDPAVSPLYADLANLCPALLTVGTFDALLEDSLLLWVRWQAAGNHAVLALHPGGVHGLTALPGALGQAALQETYRFLKER